MSEHRRLTLSKPLSAAAVAAVICAVTVGCDDASGPNPSGGLGGLSASSSTTSAPAAPTTSRSGDPAEPVDYSHLLLEASDLNDDEDTFTVQSTNPAPGGLPGASALFVNQDDTRAISNTIVVYPDAETATKTLREAIPRRQVVADATPRPVPVGTDGTIAVGESIDRSKAVTMLLFTQGPALARLEFQSALGDATTDEYVVKIGKMQVVALRAGLAKR